MYSIAPVFRFALKGSPNLQVSIKNKLFNNNVLIKE